MQIANRYQVITLMQAHPEVSYYEALDTQADKRVTLRLINTEQLGLVGEGMEHLAESKLFRKMQNEQRIIEQLKHPNLLTILDYGFDSPYYYHVYPYFPYENLEMRHEQVKRIPLKELLGYFLAISDVLAHLHQIGIVHCDICPANILLIENAAKLGEFSIANHQAQEGGVTGTIAFISPEAVTGAKPHSSRDIWSIGVSLYYLLSGEYPFGNALQGSDVPHVFQTILASPHPAITDYRPELPKRLVALINWMLEKDPAKRPESSQKISDELKLILADLDEAGEES